MPSRFAVASVVAGVTFVSSALGAGDPPRPLAMLTPEGPSQGFGGYGGAIAGGLVVVGAPLAAERGRVFVFSLNAKGGWTQAVIEPPDDTCSHFGYSVDVEGDRIVVGAPSEVGVANPAGQVYVFERNGGVWELTSQLPPAVGNTSWRGTVVSLSADRLGVRQSGGLGTLWTIGQQPLLDIACGGVAGFSEHHHSLVVDGDSIAGVNIGPASGCGQGGFAEPVVASVESGGCVHLDVPWTECADADINPPVAISGERMAFNTGFRVWTYRRIDGVWTLGSPLPTSEGGFIDLAMSGPYLAEGGNGKLSVYHLIEGTAALLWSDTPEQFGSRVAIDGDRLVAFSDNGPAPRPVYVYPVESDCDSDGVPDLDAIDTGAVTDCDGDRVPDSCQLAVGAEDCDGDGILDRCEIANGSEPDLNADGLLDRCQCLADIDGSGFVNSADLAFLLGAWGTNGGPVPAADIDWSGVVDAVDLGALLGSWGICPS